MKRIIVLPTKYITYKSTNYVAGQELDVEDDYAILMKTSGDIAFIESESAPAVSVMKKKILKPETEANNAE